MNRRKKYNRDFTCPIPRATRWRQSIQSSDEGELGHYSEHLLFSQELLEKAGLDDDEEECQFNLEGKLY